MDVLKWGHHYLAEHWCWTPNIRTRKIDFFTRTPPRVLNQWCWFGTAIPNWLATEHFSKSTCRVVSCYTRLARRRNCNNSEESQPATHALKSSCTCRLCTINKEICIMPISSSMVEVFRWLRLDEHERSTVVFVKLWENYIEGTRQNDFVTSG